MVNIDGRRPSLRGIPESLRLLNRVAVLRVLLEGPSTAPLLAERTAVSPLTISKILHSLEQEGLVRTNGLASGSPIGGKRARIWEWYGDNLFAGGVMLSVGVAQVGITDYRGTLLATLSSNFNGATKPGEVEQLIVDLLRECADLAGVEVAKLAGIGIGVPGLTDFKEGLLVFAPHLSGWKDIPFRQNLENRLGISILVDNEARVQALAERYFGLGQASSSLLCLETGVGIAAAFMTNGRIYRGDTNTAGEVGHMILDPRGPRCRCGGQGCWETLAGTGRLVSLARDVDGEERTEPYYDPSLAEVVEVFRAAERGDQRARSAIADVAYWLGIGLANLINSWNPDLIVIHGDLLAGGPQVLDTVVREVHKAALFWPAQATRIEFSKMGENVGVIGAASLIVDHSIMVPG